MKKTIIIISIFIIVILGYVQVKYQVVNSINKSKHKNIVIVKQSSNNSQTNEESIKGLELIKDDNFKNELQIFLDININNDYKNIYFYLSKRYLHAHFPNVKNANEYAKVMEEQPNPDGMILLRYIKLKNFQILNNRYLVDVEEEIVSEGKIFTQTVRFFFVKERNKWKFDGDDPYFYE